ncbi:ankyrin repeat-containing protein 32 [Elsinoe australis]|uniref:Ankyrin repeat-containing protein 32 n=1 Tax=Elsinoe australis TaxID=40998 RepID=A0A4U7AQK2_9PEZI|nr:ankyrin repeat-containing protein 32 [Elsinoe australis]
MPELPGSPIPGKELLHQVCRQGDSQALARLLARDACYEMSDDLIGDVMVTAVKYKQPVLLEYLLSRYSGPLDRYPAWLGYVHTAIFEEQAGLDMYKLLTARWPNLPADAKVGARSDGDPLAWVAFANDLEFARYLIDHGANVPKAGAFFINVLLCIEPLNADMARSREVNRLPRSILLKLGLLDDPMTKHPTLSNKTDYTAMIELLKGHGAESRAEWYDYQRSYFHQAKE